MADVTTTQARLVKGTGKSNGAIPAIVNIGGDVSGRTIASNTTESYPPTKQPQPHMYHDDDDSANNSRLGTSFRRRRLTYTAHTLNAPAMVAGQFADADSDEDDKGDGATTCRSKVATTSTPCTATVQLKRCGLNIAQAAALVAADFREEDDGYDDVEVPIHMDPIRSDHIAAHHHHHHPCPSPSGSGGGNSGGGFPRRGSDRIPSTSDTDNYFTAPPRKRHKSGNDEETTTVSHSSSSVPNGGVESRVKRATEMTLVQKPDEEFVVVPRQCAPRRRLSKEEEDNLLPFPRNLVGTYSCHGVEPVYDDDLSDGGGGEAVRGTIAKINQDRGSVAFPYGNCAKTALFAAYDGHGEGGELVAQFAMTEIQRRLHKHALFDRNVDIAFRHTFVEVDRALRTQKHIEPLYSGSTACAVLMRDSHLTISNVGDSRAVLGRRQKNGRELKAVDLSIDQNPDSPGEQERIERCGGFVSPPPEEGLSARVWLDPDFTQIGLAMSRSIGDHAVKRAGVIAEPVITTHEIMQEDEFMIIATDGVWEFIDSDEAVAIVGQYFAYGDGASRACQGLIEVAASKWHEHEGDYRDDITALVIKIQDVRRWW